MKNLLNLLLSTILLSATWAQDTFSIVAVDPQTGEVGSAGASCVDLNFFGLDADFLGDLFPGVGAINTQAWYLGANQQNARNRMLAGDTPQDIIDWLVANDVQSNASLRQYGVVRLTADNDPLSAAHTGANTDDYKGHLTGPNYAIQGNILLGPEVLDSMESNFLNTQGTLADKLMAALQGANVVGADTRCAPNGTSSLFAFLKVAQPDDPDGNPSLVLGVITEDGDGIEPVDSLQNLYNEMFPPTSIFDLYNSTNVEIFPQPAHDQVQINITRLPAQNPHTLQIFDATGKKCYKKQITDPHTILRKQELNAEGHLYYYQLLNDNNTIINTGKILFQNK